MNRRCFIQLVGVTATVGIAGCSSDADGPHDENEASSINYEYERENYVISSAYISRNAPDEVGVTVRIISEQFNGERIPVEFWALDADGNVVFHEPLIAVGLDGGSDSIATAWFEATEEEFEMDLYPKVRFREEPPAN